MYSTFQKRWLMIALGSVYLTMKEPHCLWGRVFLIPQLIPSLLLTLLLQLPLGVGMDCHPQWGLQSCAAYPEMSPAGGLLLGEFVSLHYLEFNEFPFHEPPNWSFSN